MREGWVGLKQGDHCTSYATSNFKWETGPINMYVM